MDAIEHSNLNCGPPCKRPLPKSYPGVDKSIPHHSLVNLAMFLLGTRLWARPHLTAVTFVQVFATAALISARVMALMPFTARSMEGESPASRLAVQ